MPIPLTAELKAAIVERLRGVNPELAARIAAWEPPTHAPAKKRRTRTPSAAARLKSALKATTSAGLTAARVEVATDGTVRVITGKPADDPGTEFDRWKNARSSEGR
jgi:hypothetical protein